MKKIVSVLAVAALTLFSVFAADISLEYNTKGYLYNRTETKVDGGDKTAETKILDQDGYADAVSDLILTLSNDFAGVVVDIDPSASAKTFDLDEYYGWLNLGSFQFTTGLWSARYLGRVNQDAGTWESEDYERYKPGVIGGAYAEDADNLTKDYAGNNQLAFAVAYTNTEWLPGKLMIKGVAVDLAQTTTAVETSKTWGNLNKHNVLHSGLALEVGYLQENLIDVNAIFKTMEKNTFVAGLYGRFLGVEGLDTLLGFTYGKQLEAYANKTWSSSDYYEWAVDLRARYAVNEQLAITTMHNVSATSTDSKNNTMGMWNMVSGLFKVNEQLAAQLTVENECLLSGKVADNKIKTADVGGYDISIIPGAIWNFNENASLTVGVRVNFENIAASSDYKKSTGSTTNIAIPIVFDVAL
ncbi:hypothetical protein [Treponema sp.]|uniref:hypothetical protein n=1 Tax=Treponema sp. TaxID=166 RepID=UPI003890E5F8